MNELECLVETFNTLGVSYEIVTDPVNVPQGAEPATQYVIVASTIFWFDGEDRFVATESDETGEVISRH